MDAEPSRRIAIAFARQAASSPSALWCLACIDVLAVSGAAITLTGPDDSGPICTSSPGVAALEDLQFVSGEGPYRDAQRTGRRVDAPHLEATSEWPSFAELAQSHGFAAAFAYPLTVDGATVGVMSVYQYAAGDLSTDQHDDCRALADVLAATILSLQADAPAGELADALDDAIAYRAEVYQASGMLAVQLSIPPAEALLRIRAYAFAASRPLDSVATDILAHRLRLPDDRRDRPGRKV
ncbi:MAG: GAF and ANTAR domain-containing protein [Ilumatobacteraceae bacterium]